jgi:predicted transcriptional regulator
MPRGPMLDLLHAGRPDPAAIARAFGADYPAVFRRMAALADAGGVMSLGLAICDGSGTMIFRKSAEGFPLPLFGAACPLWPLYQALARPRVPTHEVIELVGRTPRRFDCYTVAESRATEGFGGPQVTRSSMLILPSTDARDHTRAVPGRHELPDLPAHRLRRPARTVRHRASRIDPRPRRRF